RASYCSFNDTPHTEIYTLSLHDALPISIMRTVKKYPFSLTEASKNRLLQWAQQFQEFVWLDSNNYSQTHETYQAILAVDAFTALDRKSTRLNSSHVKISYAVFCLKKKNN